MGYAELKAAIAADVAGRSSGSGWVKIACPTDECYGKSAALGVSMSTGFFVCHRCNFKGRLDGYSNDNDIVVQQPGRIEPPEGFYSMSEGSTSKSIVASSARRYLEKRGVPEEMWAELQIGVCLHGKYRGRVIIPVLSNGTWIGWIGRDYTQKAFKKYIYPSGSWRASALFNGQVLADESQEPLFIVEGAFDALALWPHAVAVLGKPSKVQFNILTMTTRPLIALLDGDAWKEGWALAVRLRLVGATAGAIRLPPKVDPDEVALVDIWEAARAALATIEAVEI